MVQQLRRSPISKGWCIKGTNETIRLLLTTLIGIIIGFFLGASFQSLSLSSKVKWSSNIFDLAYFEEKYSGISTQALLNVWSSLRGRRAISKRLNSSQIWAASNPRGAERLPPGIVEAESDLYPRRLWGDPKEDLIVKPRYLITFTVGYGQRNNIDAAVKKLTENFQVVLFHYDGRTSEWDEFEWSKQAIHVSVRRQTKWWYVKRFLHPDIVAPYDYIFIWDEDLGVQNFNPEKYIKLVKEHGLDISQPGLSEESGMTWLMTRRRNDTEVHKKTEERPGWCGDPHLPPCAAFVEIMAPVFSQKAWRCVWHMIQNDLVHGWGLDFALRKCAEPAYQKIGVVDSQWIEHQSLPSLGNQGQAEDGREPWEGVRERCQHEWALFQDRMAAAEKTYIQASVNGSAADQLLPLTLTPPPR